MAENERNEIISRLVRIETLLEPLTCVNDKLHATQYRTEQNSKEIADMKDANKWLWRTIAGAIITALVSIGMNFYK
jgi:hypothetical protein